ncbi:Wzz/FepE/Etk N-terminal domain-containing protein [Butyricimonas hominis]|uniref:Wzz/FepE/Etk N-terminal domain-containing protein n=1 Tax=Butyricimonas TaxID=574697 RepID=UPI00351354B2
MQEFDVTDLLRLLWRKKSFILKTTFICLCLGVLVVLLSSKQYTSISSFIPQKPQTDLDKSALDAYLQRESPSIYEANEVLNPGLYPRVVENVTFRKKVMYMPVWEGKDGKKVNLVEYLSSDEYHPFHFGRWLKKYTIGLPATIRTAKKGGFENAMERDTSLLILSPKEQRAADVLQRGVVLWIGEDNALLQVTTGDPVVAARLAQNVLSLLKEEVTNYRSAKIEEQWVFLKRQIGVVMQELKAKQQEMAELQTKQHVLSTGNIDIQKGCLLAEYQHLYGSYQEFNGKLERLKLKTQDNTPVFTMLEEVYVPYQASAPRRGIILTAFVALGLFLGMVLVITLPYIAEVTRSKFLMRHFSVKGDQVKDVE